MFVEGGNKSFGNMVELNLNLVFQIQVTCLLIISIVVTIFSLPYAIGLSASKSLLNVSRLCGLIVAILWIIIILFALINGLNVGMLGVYLVKPSLIFLLLILYLALRVFWRDKQ